MKVEDLQLHLTNLSQLFRSAKSTSIANELDEFAAQLQPYRDKKLADFLALIAKADADRTMAQEQLKAMEAKLAAAGVKPPPKAAAKKAAMDSLFTKLADLYHRAAHPTVTREDMESALKELEGLKPTEKDLKQLAPQLNVPTNFKKDALLRQIRDALLSRKGMAERVNV